MTDWDHEVDVVVLGSGGAGLTSALTAAVNGASVVGRAKGRDFASGELFRLPLDHLREMHESWLPTWIEGRA